MHLPLVSVAIVLLVFSATASGQQAAPQVPQVMPMLETPDEVAFVPDQVIVKFEEWLDQATRMLIIQAVGARWQESGYGGFFELLQVVPGRVLDVVNALSGIPGVVYAEPNYLAYATATPNDPFFSPYQWNFYDYGVLSNGYPSNYGIQAQTAWNTTSGANTTVAICDTGVAYENYGSFYQAPDLAGQTFVSPYNFINNTTHANDDNGHGTHVCGTVAQRTDNGMGVAGVAYSCRIMPVKVLNSAGSGTHAQVANGINYAANNGANVINLSLASSSGSSTLENAVNYAWGQGCVLCAATGNSGRKVVYYPARYTNCVAVGATRFDGVRPRYSQYGTGIDVVAPGGDTSRDQNHDGYGDGILQQTFSGGYGNFAYYFFQGTSMATPHVSAVAALVKSYHPGYTNAEVRAAIESTTKDLGKNGYDTTYGWGLVNAAAALTY
ncbi:MAG: S8 family peptidase [Planctomycetota bacterium]